MRLQNSGFHSLGCPLIKGPNLFSWVDPSSTSPVLSASISLHHLITLKCACTYSPWKCPPPNSTGSLPAAPLTGPRSLHFFPERGLFLYLGSPLLLCFDPLTTSHCFFSCLMVKTCGQGCIL